MIHTLGVIKRPVRRLEIAEWRSYCRHDSRLVPALPIRRLRGKTTSIPDAFDIVIDEIHAIQFRCFESYGGVIVSAATGYQSQAVAESSCIARTLDAEFIPVSRQFTELELMIEQCDGFVAKIHEKDEICFGQICYITPHVSRLASARLTEGQIAFHPVNMETKRFETGLCCREISNEMVISCTGVPLRDLFTEEERIYWEID